MVEIYSEICSFLWAGQVNLKKGWGGGGLEPDLQNEVKSGAFSGCPFQTIAWLGSWASSVFHTRL